MTDERQSKLSTQGLPEQSSKQSSSNGVKRRSAPEYPPATDRSKRTNSANFGEGESDENVAAL